MATMKASDWIKVEDSLPELEEDVLVAGYFDGVGDMETWFSHRSKNKLLLRDNNDFAIYDEKAKITHWMKVVLPKED